MSTQRIDAIDLTKKIQALIRDCLRRSNLLKCDRDAKLAAYGEILDLIIELTHQQ